jgi:hypothetical protein
MKFKKMNKIKKTTILQFEKIFTIIVFLTFVFLMRNILIETYDREVDLNVEKTVIIAKKKSDKKLYENFAKTDKKNFSNKLSQLILMMLTFFFIIYNIQRKINAEKNKLNNNE